VIARLVRFWTDHSLSIVLGVLGAVSSGTAFLADPGTRWWDLFLGLGQGLLTVTAFNVLAGRFREVNKPDA
jgi:hypothetical protein